MEEEKRVLVSKRAIHECRVLEDYRMGYLSRKEVASILGICERQVGRKYTRYIDEGIQGLEHRSFGKESPNRISQAERERVIDLARNKFPDFNLKHLHEHLQKYESLKMSYSSLKRILNEVGDVKRPRKKKKARSRRARYHAEGMMLQMDGSHHEWVKGAEKWVLIAGIDDATSDILYGEFFKVESLEGYLEVLREIFARYGVPRILYVDRAGWLSGTTRTDEGGQFQRMCEELGIHLIFANSPQAKGRIERAWLTLQDRLIAEFRFWGIKTMQEATKYFNEQFLVNTWRPLFTVKQESLEKAYLTPPESKELDRIFCLKFERKIRRDHTILWGNRTYQITTKLKYSIAGRKLELRVNSKGDLTPVFAGKELELTEVKKVEDRGPSPGLRIDPKSLKESHSVGRKIVKSNT